MTDRPRDAPRHRLLPFDRARRIALATARPIRRTEVVAVPAALGRVAASDVRSPIDVPSADRAAMDGYAVRSRDTVRATPSQPAVLDRIEVVYAGARPRKRLTPGRCTEVATGSMLPRGADAVVRVEDTRRTGSRIEVRASAARGENVFRLGSDIARGSTVVRAGDPLTPAKVGALSAIGRVRTQVFAKPRVAILVTGDEVVPPGRKIRAGQVYDINSNSLAAIVREAGGEPVLLGRVADRIGSLQAAMRRALASDLVVVSGGSSVGRKDLVVDVVRSMGTVLFHGVAVKPGRPTGLGRVRGKAVLAMPGNPTSCLSNGYVLLAPMLRRIARLPPREPAHREVPLARGIRKPRGRVEILTVRIVRGHAVPASKESGAITSMAHADGYIEIPADVERLDAGTKVRVALF